jgi:hypothetical protein
VFFYIFNKNYKNGHIGAKKTECYNFLILSFALNASKGLAYLEFNALNALDN